jgi:hypothetical protein
MKCNVKHYIIPFQNFILTIECNVRHYIRPFQNVNLIIDGDLSRIRTNDNHKQNHVKGDGR